MCPGLSPPRSAMRSRMSSRVTHDSDRFEPGVLMSSTRATRRGTRRHSQSQVEAVSRSPRHGAPAMLAVGSRTSRELIAGH